MQTMQAFVDSFCENIYIYIGFGSFLFQCDVSTNIFQDCFAGTESSNTIV